MDCRGFCVRRSCLPSSVKARYPSARLMAISPGTDLFPARRLLIAHSAYPVKNALLSNDSRNAGDLRRHRVLLSFIAAGKYSGNEGADGSIRLHLLRSQDDAFVVESR